MLSGSGRLLPNARRVSKAILHNDAVAMEATFKASGGGKAAANGGIRFGGGGFGYVGPRAVWGGCRAFGGGSIYVPTALLPGPLPVRSRRVCAAGAVRPASGRHGVAPAAPLAPVTSKKGRIRPRGGGSERQRTQGRRPTAWGKWRSWPPGPSLPPVRPGGRRGSRLQPTDAGATASSPG